MATELNLTIRGETAAEVMQELAAIGARAAGELGVAPQPANPEPAPEPAKSNGAEPAAPKTRGRKAPPPAEPEPPKLDRAAIIEGLTKVYSKGNEDVRLAITKFRDGQGADRLRDLKDDALPAAAELLAELKLEAADAP